MDTFPEDSLEVIEEKPETPQFEIREVYVVRYSNNFTSLD